MQLFSIKNLNYSYDERQILFNINFAYDNNDFVSIIGPNGAGKSTLLKLILGLIKIDKKNLDLNIKRSEIGYVPQYTNINSNFSARVLDVVLMGLLGRKIFGFYSKLEKNKALKALEKVGLKDYANALISELSGGQRQRVFIARALVDECKLLILDEPTASVDSKAAVQIFDLLNALHEQGIGVLMVSHDINITLAYSDKIAYLNKNLFLHNNTKERQKEQFLHHLYQNHTHFCDVELSLNSCLCDDLGCIDRELCNKELSKCSKIFNANLNKISLKQDLKNVRNS